MNIEQLRKFCLALPFATEDIKWGSDLCFCVGEKMFCVTGADSSEGGLTFKCTPEQFAELCEREGIGPAPYLARHNWVALESPSVLPAAELRECIRGSHQLVFDKLPKGVRSKLEASAGK